MWKIILFLLLLALNSVFGSQPSARPSTKPSTRPSPSPSVFPTREPSPYPSIIPTVTPTSAIPTYRPTPKPSSIPSAKPSSSPTVKPSPKPTSSPSARSTAIPTQIPTTPTRVPSAFPSPNLNVMGLWKLKLNLLTQNLSGLLTYEELMVDNQLMDGGCYSWLSYASGPLKRKYSMMQAEQISIIASSSYDDLKFESITCNNSSAVSLITDQIISPSTIVSSIQCNGSVWKIKACDGNKPSICVNCSDPCFSKNCSNLNEYYISPCASLSGGSCPSVDSSIHILTAQFNEKDNYPTIHNTSFTSSRRSIRIKATLSKPGYISCAAFEISKTLSNINELLIQNNIVNTYSFPYAINITINNLSPSTLYNIYCTTQGVDGQSMGLATVLKANYSYSTTCCKHVYVDLYATYVHVNDELINAVRFSLDSIETESLLINVKSSGLLSYGLQPEWLNIQNKLSLTASLSSVNTKYVGSTFLNISLSGIASVKYDIIYRNSKNSFHVINSTYIGIAPKLLNATLNKNGDKVIVIFDIATDLGDIKTTFFSCSILFDASNIHIETARFCTWINDWTVAISLKSNPTLLPGDTISILGSKIKAKCNIEYNCSNWIYNKIEMVTVSYDFANALTPTVSLNIPSIIGIDNILFVDLSAVTGLGNRPWSSIKFSLAGSNSSFSYLDAENILNYWIDFSTPIMIPATYFSVGSVTIQCTICNFMNNCGQGSSYIEITSSVVPTVTIAGALIRYIKRSNGLELFADAFTLSVSDGDDDSSSIITRENLYYMWSIEQLSGSFDSSFSSILSISKQNNVYKLPSYTFQLRSLYQITLTVLHLESFQSSLVSVQVYVMPGNIKAMILGGEVRSVNIHDNITLDASHSYDEDIGDSMRLSFDWNCVTVKPNINSSYCPFDILSTDTTSSNINLLSTGTFMSINTTAELTVTVYDVTRSSSAVVYVTIVSRNIPTVSITTISNDKINPSNKLFISGQITSLSPGIASWSINDSAIYLSNSALTTYSQRFTSYNLSSQSFNLVLKPNSLFSSSFYRFTLHFQSVNGYKSYSSIVFDVNDVPTPGVFLIEPTSGFELNDIFTFIASQWIDDDLPLRYTFGFYQSSAGSSIKIVQPQSEFNYAYTPLPAGETRNNFTLSCGLIVSDIFNAETNTYNNVIVRRYNNSFTPNITLLIDYMDYSLSETCNKATLLCGNLSKSCATDCSGHGSCYYVDSDHIPGAIITPGERLSNCFIVDNTCTTACSCDDGYYGSLCEYDLLTFTSIKSIRFALINQLYNNTLLDDITSSSILTWTSLLSSLTSKIDEISFHSTSLITNIIDTILTSATSLSYPSITNELLLPLMTSVDHNILVEKNKKQKEYDLKRLEMQNMKEIVQEYYDRNEKMRIMMNLPLLKHNKRALTLLDSGTLLNNNDMSYLDKYCSLIEAENNKFIRCLEAIKHNPLRKPIIMNQLKEQLLILSNDQLPQLPHNSPSNNQINNNNIYNIYNNNNNNDNNINNNDNNNKSQTSPIISNPSSPAVMKHMLTRLPSKTSQIKKTKTNENIKPTNNDDYDNIINNNNNNSQNDVNFSFDNVYSSSKDDNFNANYNDLKSKLKLFNISSKFGIVLQEPDVDEDDHNHYLQHHNNNRENNINYDRNDHRKYNNNNNNYDDDGRDDIQSMSSEEDQSDLVTALQKYSEIIKNQKLTPKQSIISLPINQIANNNNNNNNNRNDDNKSISIILSQSQSPNLSSSNTSHSLQPLELMRNNNNNNRKLYNNKNNNNNSNSSIISNQTKSAYHNSRLDLMSPDIRG
eukprot:gene6998-9563_t